MTEATAPDDGTHRIVPPQMEAGWEAATTDPDPLAALRATRALAALLPTWEAGLVGEAMDAGATWEAIGGTVGVSRQAAWERFHDDVQEFRRTVKAEARALRDRHRSEVDSFRNDVRTRARTRRGRA